MAEIDGVLPTEEPVVQFGAMSAAVAARCPFAVGTKDSSDLLAARRVAEFIGSDHHEVIATAESIGEELDNAVEVIGHYDPALVHSAVPNLLLACEAAKKVGGTHR